MNKKILIIIGAVLVMVGIIVMFSFDSNIVCNPNLSPTDKVQPVKIGHANIYFIKTNTGYILVDAAMPDNEEKLEKAFSLAGVDPQKVQLIILTHGHLDHIGSLAYAKKITGAKVVCHRSISDYLEKGTIEPAVPQNAWGRFLNAITPSKIKAVQADILLEDQFDLAEFGIAGKIIPTPGHSPSSISIILDSGETLVGDLIREEKEGQIGLGMFYENKKLLMKSLETLAAFESRKIYLSHGSYIDNATLRKTITMHQEKRS